MIGLDTNVLVRYLIRDDAAQAALAADLLEQTCSEHTPGYISSIVLCETIWVLERVNRLEREVLVSILETLLTTKHVLVENRILSWEAMEIFARTKAGFSDILIALLHMAAGCKHTATFDKKAATYIPGMVLVNTFVDMH